MLTELATTWWDAMQVGAVWALVGAALFAGMQVTRREASPEVTWIVWFVALVAGLGQVWMNKSLLDDAFISFRHASNTLAGYGPVFNAGEHVEGVVNLGWTLVLAVGGLSGLEIPTVSVLLTLMAYVGLGALALRIGQGLWETDDGRVYIPFAAILILVQTSITPFGTSGLETAPVALCTLAAAGFIAGGHRHKYALAGLFTVFAALLRPDHAVFWLAGAIVIGTRDRRRLVQYLAPATLAVAFIAFKLWFYGSLIPNPFYALGADSLPFSRGLARLTVYAVAEHLLVIVVLFGLWWRTSVREEESDLRAFLTLGVAAHAFAVTAMGASTTYGQVYLTDLVLLLLGAEAVLHHRTPLPSWGAAALLGSTLGGLPLLPPFTTAFDMTLTHTFFPLDNIQPVTVRHHTQYIGEQFRRVYAKGEALTVATCCGVGNVAWHSGVEVIHTDGFTDAHIARIESETNLKPLDLPYLRQREVDLVRNNWAPAYAHLTHVTFAGHDNLNGLWHLFRYEPERVASLRKHARSLSFVDFESHLDQAIEHTDDKTKDQLLADLAFYDAFYFDHTDDVGRRAKLTAAIDAK